MQPEREVHRGAARERLSEMQPERGAQRCTEREVHRDAARERSSEVHREIWEWVSKAVRGATVALSST